MQLHQDSDTWNYTIHQSILRSNHRQELIGEIGNFDIINIKRKRKRKKDKNNNNNNNKNLLNKRPRKNKTLND